MIISTKQISLFVIVFILFTIFMSAVAIVHRGWVSTVTALPHIPVRCPSNARAFIIIGQSQGSNTGQARRIPQRNDNAYSFSNGSCYRLRDPIPGTAGRSGSIWPSFVDQFNEAVIIANLAISGSSIEEWTTKGSIERIKSTLESLDQAGFSHQIIILMQGETNSSRHTTSYLYFQHLNVLYNTAPNRNWLITRESICYKNQVKWQPLDDARDKFANLHDNVTIGPDLDKIGTKYRQNDKCHFTTSGQDLLAINLARAARKINIS